MTVFLLPNVKQLHLIKENFVHELAQAESGVKNSLVYLRHPLPEKITLGANEIFQVMVIGGSLFQKALVRLKGQTPSIIDYDKSNLPPLNSRQALCQLVQTNLDGSISKLALNFTYPLKSELRNGLLDGVLLKGTKESTFNGLVGNLVGRSLEDYFLTRNRRIQITVANDIICLALVGLATGKAKNEIVAGVVGTGVNFGFFEGNSVVNLESGNFDKLVRSASGKFLDSFFPKIRGQVFEKEVSGAYLYQHFNFWTKREHLSLRLSSTHELNALTKTNSAEGTLARQLLERSSALVATQIAGIAQYLAEQIHSRSLTYFMEGSLIWEGHNYLENVKKYVELLGVPKEMITFFRLAKSSLLGACYLFVPRI